MSPVDVLSSSRLRLIHAVPANQVKAKLLCIRFSEEEAGGLFVSQTITRDAESGPKGKESAGVRMNGNAFYLRVKVSKDAICTFSYSNGGTTFSPVGEPFAARKGKWIGAKVGLFAVRTGKTRETGYADFDWFRVE